MAVKSSKLCVIQNPFLFLLFIYLSWCIWIFRCIPYVSCNWRLFKLGVRRVGLTGRSGSWSGSAGSSCDPANAAIVQQKIYNPGVFIQTSQNLVWSLPRGAAHFLNFDFLTPKDGQKIQILLIGKKMPKKCQSLCQIWANLEENQIIFKYF